MSVILLITNKKSHTGFRLIPTSMTLILQRGLSAIAELLVDYIVGKHPVINRLIDELNALSEKNSREQLFVHMSVAVKFQI